MEVQTKLQDLFIYSFTPLITIIIVTILILIILFFLNHPKKQIEPIKVINPSNPKTIKDKYLSLINILINKINNKSISNRHAYQELSKIIRNFIYEMTSIKVQNYTLTEIKTLNMPYLSSLVEEYYDPEFAFNSTGNILNSINKTKEVILKWH